MKQISTEKFIERLKTEVYPITIVKFLLNRGKIVNFISKMADKDDFRGPKFKLDHSDCELCKEKEERGILCRKHTSIERVLTAETVLYDLDTNLMFFRNEIFRMVDKKLVIVYCPHPKLISGEITDEKVRKINFVVVEDDIQLPDYNIRKIISSELMDEYLRCWFNDLFSLVTIPNDRNASNWCLIPNSVQNYEVKNHE